MLGFYRVSLLGIQGIVPMLSFPHQFLRLKTLSYHSFESSINCHFRKYFCTFIQQILQFFKGPILNCKCHIICIYEFFRDSANNCIMPKLRRVTFLNVQECKKFCKLTNLLSGMNTLYEITQSAQLSSLRFKVKYKSIRWNYHFISWRLINTFYRF